MADKQISELTAASNLTDSTLLVVEQGGSAKKANFGMMKNYISPGVASLYSNSSTYAVGDYVLYQDTLYRCTTAITTAEAWTAAHWTAAVLGDDVGDLKSAFNKSEYHQMEIVDDVGGDYSISRQQLLVGETVFDGYQIQPHVGENLEDLQKSQNNNAINAVIPVLSFSSATIYQYGTTAGYGSAFVDDGGTVVGAVINTNPAGYITVSIPAEAKYLVYSFLGASEPMVTMHKNISYLTKTDIPDKITIMPPSEYENAGIAATMGNYVPNLPQRLLSVNGIEKGYSIIQAAEGYSFTLYAYNTKEISTNNYVGLWNGTQFLHYPDSPVWLSSAYNPNDAYYYYIMVRKDDNANITPETASDKISISYSRFTYYDNEIDKINNSINNIEQDETYFDLHTKPQSVGALNAIKRARQMSDIKWTPVENLPRTGIVTPPVHPANYQRFQDRFDANKEYSGLPYGDTSDVPHMLGVARPFDVFVSSVYNKDTALYKESVYHGTYATYYYCACTGLTAYALNFPVVYSSNYANIEGMSKMFDLVTNGVRHSLNDIQLCDILKISGHCAMITDIIKNENNDVVFIEVTEQTTTGNINPSALGTAFGGKARRKTWNIEEFFTWFADFSIYRYAKLDSVPFIDVPSSPTIFEGERIYNPYYPIVPYYGNRCMIEGNNRTVKLLIAASGYTHVVVTKNGVAWNENGTTDAYAINGDELTITCDNDNAEYAAKLVTYQDGAIYYFTTACEWYVFSSANVSVTDSDNTLTFTVRISTDEFYPWFVNTRYPDNTLSGYNHLVNDSYTHTESSGTHIYQFTQTYTGSAPTRYLIGIKSDKYGLIQLSGATGL